MVQLLEHDSYASTNCRTCGRKQLFYGRFQFTLEVGFCPRCAENGHHRVHLHRNFFPFRAQVVEATCDDGSQQWVRNLDMRQDAHHVPPDSTVNAGFLHLREHGFEPRNDKLWVTISALTHDPRRALRDPIFSPQEEVHKLPEPPLVCSNPAGDF